LHDSSSASAARCQQVTARTNSLCRQDAFQHGDCAASVTAAQSQQLLTGSKHLDAFADLLRCVRHSSLRKITEAQLRQHLVSYGRWWGVSLSSLHFDFKVASMMRVQSISEAQLRQHLAASGRWRPESPIIELPESVLWYFEAADNW